MFAGTVAERALSRTVSGMSKLTSSKILDQMIRASTIVEAAWVMLARCD